jgi:hypothetical protein
MPITPLQVSERQTSRTDSLGVNHRLQFSTHPDFLPGDRLAVLVIQYVRQECAE